MKGECSSFAEKKSVGERTQKEMTCREMGWV